MELGWSLMETLEWAPWKRGRHSQIELEESHQVELEESHKVTPDWAPWTP